MLLFWGLVILAFAVLLKWLGGGSTDESRAIDILNARYAKGELTREQFEQLKRELGEQPPRLRNRALPPLAPKDVDAVGLTYAHLDHTG